jgi:hypothetical protein
MAETPDETRREIEDTRLRIAEAAEELEERFQRTTDWRHIVDEYPLEVTLGAFGIGFVLGSGLIFKALGAAFGVVRGGGGRVPQAGIGQAQAPAGAGLLNFIQPIVTPLITAKALDYLGIQQPQGRGRR